MLLAKLYVWWVTGNALGSVVVKVCSSQCFPAQLRTATTVRAGIMDSKKAPVCAMCLPVSVSVSPSRWLVDRHSAGYN